MQQTDNAVDAVTHFLHPRNLIKRNRCPNLVPRARGG